MKNASHRGCVRIISGTARGRLIEVPAGDTRPTLDRVREALFNVLGPRIEGTRFLDLFAGSGAHGLEALSRGAAFSHFADADPQAARTIRKSIEQLGFAGRAGVSRIELPEGLPRAAGRLAPFDIVFADPPYAWPHTSQLLQAIARLALIRPGGVCVVEHSSRTAAPTADGALLEADATRTYGSSALSFFRCI